MAMVRKQIYLTQELDEKVKQLAKARNVPEAEIIRAALEQYGTYQATDAGHLAVRETATLPYGARTMEREEKASGKLLLEQRRKDAWDSLLAQMKERAQLATNKTAEGGRGWTREDLYDERPEYLSR